MSRAPSAALPVPPALKEALPCATRSRSPRLSRPGPWYSLVAGAPDSSAAPGGSPTPTGSGPAASSIKVGMAYDIGGRGDKSFNDSAAAGLDKAKAELRRRDQGVRRGRRRDRPAARSAADPPRAGRVQPGHRGRFRATPVRSRPSRRSTPTPTSRSSTTSSNLQPNVANLVFAANQGSYLVGVVAAQAATSGKIGFIGGVNVPLIQAFQAGFDAGVKARQPGRQGHGQVPDPAAGLHRLQRPGQGQDGSARASTTTAPTSSIAAAGGSGNGVFKAAKAAEQARDRRRLRPVPVGHRRREGLILTSALKRVDAAVYDFIKSAVDGSTLTGVQTFRPEQRRGRLLQVQPRSPAVRGQDRRGDRGDHRRHHHRARRGELTPTVTDLRTRCTCAPTRPGRDSVRAELVPTGRRPFAARSGGTPS